MERHYRALERMYLQAPTNGVYRDLRLVVEEGIAEVSITVDSTLHHIAGAMHGAHYFKLLDDAAYFAVNSLVEDVFVLTVQMSTQLIRPVVEGHILARGRVVKPGRTTFLASAELHDAAGRLIATGQGSFNRSSMRVSDNPYYHLDDTPG